jgi:type IV pilus assembly protein PilV
VLVNLKTNPHRAKGFSLVEVMVALVVTAIGLLGLAKMESLALSSTGVAGQRSLAAIQASSLAAMMHANRDYWASDFVVADSPINAIPGAAAPCTQVAPCSFQAMATYDIQQWAASLQSLLPGYFATITCAKKTATGALIGVVSCAINIQWVENTVALDKNQSGLGANTANPSYTLYVEP